MKTTAGRHLLVLTLLVAAVFGNTLRHGFVWDDTLFVPEGEVYRNFDLAAIFFSLRANGLEYLPVRDLSYALDCNLWGSNPAGFHGSNLICYWLSILAVYFLTASIATICRQEDAPDHVAPRVIAFLTAALFAVHPIHSETVSFITCRNALLSGLFLFLACTAWLRYLTGTARQRPPMYAAALLCFLLALFAKATAIMLPLLLLGATWLCCRPLSRRHWLALTPFFILAAGAFRLFTTIARQTDVFLREPAAPLGDKLILAVQIPLFYLGKLIVPLDLSADYGSEQFARLAVSSKVIGSLLVLAMLITAAWRYRRKAPLFTVAIAWLLLAMIPALHLFPTLPVVADRYAYLPSFGFCLLLATGIVRLPEGRRWLVAAPVLLLLALLAARQNLVWKDEKTLWEKTLAASPRSVNALAELGRIYFWEEKNPLKAMEMFQRAQAINPADPAIDLFQGHLFMMQRDYSRAVMAFRSALEKDGSNIEAALNLGRAYESSGDKAAAREQYRRAADLPELDPRTKMRNRALNDLQRLEGR